MVHYSQQKSYIKPFAHSPSQSPPLQSTFAQVVEETRNWQRMRRGILKIYNSGKDIEHAWVSQLRIDSEGIPDILTGHFKFPTSNVYTASLLHLSDSVSFPKLKVALPFDLVYKKVGVG